MSNNNDKKQSPLKRDTNNLSVSFQVPSNSASIDWMTQIELDYYIKARSSVVAEVRSKKRAEMLRLVSMERICTPWALNCAQSPVYMHPHAEKLLPFLKEQANALQKECEKSRGVQLSHQRAMEVSKGATGQIHLSHKLEKFSNSMAD